MFNPPDPLAPILAAVTTELHKHRAFGSLETIPDQAFAALASGIMTAIAKGHADATAATWEYMMTFTGPGQSLAIPPSLPVPTKVVNLADYRVPS